MHNFDLYTPQAWNLCIRWKYSLLTLPILFLTFSFGIQEFLFLGKINLTNSISAWKSRQRATLLRFSQKKQAPPEPTPSPPPPKKKKIKLGISINLFVMVFGYFRKVNTVIIKRFSLSFSIFRDVVFGPPGRSKAGILFYFCNLFLWGYPVYFYYVSMLLLAIKWKMVNFILSFHESKLYKFGLSRVCCSQHLLINKH